MYKQRQREYTDAHTHINTNRDRHAHSGTQWNIILPPPRVRMNAVHIWNKVPSLLFLLLEWGAATVFLSPTWHTDTDTLRQLC